MLKLQQHFASKPVVYLRSVKHELIRFFQSSCVSMIHNKKDSQYLRTVLAAVLVKSELRSFLNAPLLTRKQHALVLHVLRACNARLSTQPPVPDVSVIPKKRKAAVQAAKKERTSPVSPEKVKKAAAPKRNIISLITTSTTTTTTLVQQSTRDALAAAANNFIDSDNCDCVSYAIHTLGMDSLCYGMYSDTHMHSTFDEMLHSYLQRKQGECEIPSTAPCQ